MNTTRNSMDGTLFLQHEGRPSMSQDRGLAKNGHLLAQFTARRRNWLLIQARTVCRNASDAEDLVQEALLRFILAFEGVDPIPNERVCESWLMTTLTNLFYDQCRKKSVRSRNQADLDLELCEEVAVAEEPLNKPVYDKITDAQFAQALQALSPKLRETFELHAAGMKYQDIAQKLGIQLGTVCKRLHDARAKLRELLKPYTHQGMN